MIGNCWEFRECTESQRETCESYPWFGNECWKVCNQKKNTIKDSPLEDPEDISNDSNDQCLNCSWYLHQKDHTNVGYG